MGRITRRRFLQAAGAGAAIAGSGIAYLALTSGPEAPGVIWITADAMRADGLGRRCLVPDADGNPVMTALTPTLDALSGRGTTFTCALAPSTWTATSMMSTMYNIDPAHAVYGNFDTVAAEQTSLTERFRDAGYVTIGVFANDVLEMPGMKKGFDSCRFLHLSERSRRDSKIARVPICREIWGTAANRVATHCLDRHRRELRKRPLYLQIHYMDTHDPYNKLSFSQAGPWSDRLGTHNMNVAAEVKGRRVVIDRERGMEASVEEATGYLIGNYNSGINAIDRAVSELLQGLEKRGYLKNALLIFTSDHGEEFADNSEFQEKRFGHVGRLSQVQIRVPLLAASTGGDCYLGGGGKVSEPVGAGEVVNRLLCELLEGSNKDQVRQAVQAGRFPPHRILSAVHFPGNRTRPLEKDPVRQSCTVAQAGAKRYKIVRDYREGRDLLFEMDASGGVNAVEMTAEMARAADAAFSGTAPSKVVISPEEKARLEALGYIGQ